MTKKSKWAVASNTRECFRAIIGETVKGLLFDAFPRNRSDLSRGNVTIVFEGYHALTISDSGTYWMEDPDQVRMATNESRKRLEAIEAEIKDVLELAGESATP